MRSIPRWMLRHRVTVEPFTGEGPYGAAYGPAVVVRAFVDDKRRHVRDETGNQVVSEATVYMPLETSCPARSRVTLPDGRTATVIRAARRDGGSLPTPDHLEVTLT